MSQPPKKKKKPSRGLGRGLSALMSDIAPVTQKPTKEAPVEPHLSQKVQETIETEAKVRADKSAGQAKGAGAVSAAQNISKTKSASEQAATGQIANTASGVRLIPIADIERNPDQPRRVFDKALLEELTASIAEKGVLQPILVRPLPKKTTQQRQRYQIVAGERRWQASLKVGLTSLPALVRDLSDQDVLEIGVVENVQRADLNPIEEAMAYKALVDQFSRRQDDIAKAVGKSRAHIANMMRLLTLPLRAREYLAEGKLSIGHARAIISAPDPNALAQLIVDKGLSVREAEKVVRAGKQGVSPRKALATKSADIRAVELALSEKLGLHVSLNHKNPHGNLRIDYKTAEQLEDLIKRLQR